MEGCSRNKQDRVRRTLPQTTHPPKPPLFSAPSPGLGIHGQSVELTHPWFIYSSLLFHPPVSPSICKNLAAVRSAGVRLLPSDESKCRKRGRLLMLSLLLLLVPAAPLCSLSLSNSRRLLSAYNKRKQSNTGRERKEGTQRGTEKLFLVVYADRSLLKQFVRFCVGCGGVHGSFMCGAWEARHVVGWRMFGTGLLCPQPTTLYWCRQRSGDKHAREGCRSPHWSYHSRCATRAPRVSLRLHVNRKERGSRQTQQPGEQNYSNHNHNTKPRWCVCLGYNAGNENEDEITGNKKQITSKVLRNRQET